VTARDYVMRWLYTYPALPLRRRVSRGGAVGFVPRALRTRLDLDTPPAGPLRVELGSGPWPTEGYVHVDTDRYARHVEHRSPMWRLPFAAGTVHEVLAVHCLEHVPPGRLRATLREWRRVLAPGGFAEVHVPNAPAVLRAWESAPFRQKWALTNGLLGTYLPAEELDPDDFDDERNRPDHRALFDLPVLETLLRDAGFTSVTDLTGTVTDRHTEAWAPFVRDYSLVVRAE
jgi:SAM-dependent methyltransferase